MSQVIPGGRPRASSDGDILDEGLCGTLFVNLNDRNNEAPRKNPGRAANVNINSNNSSNCIDVNNDEFDSDSELSSQSQSSSARSRRRGFSFKSMRKAVSRAFVKDSKLGETAPKKSDRSYRASDLSKVWTPDLRHLGEASNGKAGKSNNEIPDSGTMSTARPLITDPNVGMTVPKWKKTPGTTGIYNHGSTCFMNAVLQCLSNTDSFTEYFVRDFFKSDLRNSKNGKKGVFRSAHGEVTEQLGILLKCLWSGKYASNVSWDFKTVVGKYNSQYKGEQQHDSQEFLLWLLDRIHEDVSIFTKKKNKPQKTPVLKSDEELALEAASVNGDSFVLKLFQALHSSTLTCPTCGERSSTFDPYLCVSLPLPQGCPRVVYVILVSPESSEEVKMAITLNQFDGVRDLREHVASDAKVPAKQLLLVQLKDDGFGATYSDEQPLSDVPDNELLYAIKTYSDDLSMHSSTQEFDTPTTQVLVMHVEASPGSSRSYRFGSPAMLRVRRDITWKNLQKEILYMMDDSVCEEILSQKLSTLFRIRVYDGSSRKNYLTPEDEMPLYTQSAESAYSSLDEDFGPAHIKLIAEWDPSVKKTVVLDDKEHIVIHPSVTDAQNNPRGQGKVSLEECFRLYTQEEKLIGDDAWLCPHCKQQQQGTIKTLGLWSLPDILVLHLKRFKQSGQRRSKLNTLVDFPVENLDMSSHLSRRNHSSPLKRDEYTYDLLGVCNHYGDMMGGHYTAFCRSPVDGEWREFNDTEVRTLKGSIATREAYLLFYQRRSLSKDINQRLFTGTHWVFTLSLASSEQIEEETSTSGETSPREAEPTQRTKRSRSRSASPSARRQVIKDGAGSTARRIPSRPLTPQLNRRPMISYTDDKDFDDSRPTSPPSPTKSSPTRKSRPVQRQASEPGSQFRRERSAGGGTVKPRDSSRTLYNRKGSEDEELKDLYTDLTRKNSKREVTINGVRSQSQPRGKLPDKEKQPLVIIKHNPAKGNDLSVNTSKTISHQSYSLDNSLESDAKYPSAYDYTRYSDTKNGLSSLDSNPTLQVKLDDRDSYLSGHSQAPYLDLSETKTARKKLAQCMKQSSLERELAHVRLDTIDTIEEEQNFVRKDSRKYGSQRNNPINISDYDDLNISHTTNGHTYGVDSQTSEKDSDFRLSRWQSNRSYRSHGYSRLEEKENYSVLPSGLERSSELRSKLRDETRYEDFCNLAERHFGPSDGMISSKGRYMRFPDDTSVGNSGYTSSYLNGDMSRLNKYNTITSRVTSSNRHDWDPIPRSNTDDSIHYPSSLVPPPSPTPPHTPREKRTFNDTTGLHSLPSSTINHSNRYTGRDPSFHSYRYADWQASDQESLTSTGRPTQPAYVTGIHQIRQSRHHFQAPRGVWGVKPKTAKSMGNLPTPCLRESSV